MTSPVVWPESDVVLVDRMALDRIKEMAEASPKRRARLCLHRDHRDRVQEMVIALRERTYVRPHRQLGKRKTYTLIEGALETVFFADGAAIAHKQKLGLAGAFIYTFPSSSWHTVVALSPMVIYVETIAGPYVEGATEFAPWSPDEEDAARASEFFSSLTRV